MVVGDTNKLDANGKKTGIWREDKSLSSYFGNYVNDKKEGVWVGYHPNGLLSSLEEYKGGKKNGVSVGIDVAGFYFKKDNFHYTLFWFLLWNWKS